MTVLSSAQFGQRAEIAGEESLERGQPLVETFARLNFQACRVARGIGAKCRDGNFRGGDFARVPDEPLLEARQSCLRMKLEAERAAAPGKSLVAANLCRREQSRPFRQIEGIPV